MADSSPYIQAANAAASKYGVNPDIFASLIGVESGWNPSAQAQGSSAYGLTQMVAGTAKQMGVTDKTDPMQQLDGGAKYLSQMLQSSGGDYTTALAKYNQGPAGDLSKGSGYAAKVLQGAGYAADGSKLGAGEGWLDRLPGGTTRTTSSPMTKAGDSVASAGGAFGWLQEHIGDIALVVTGVMVIGIALVASTRMKTTLINTVTKAVV